MRGWADFLNLNDIPQADELDVESPFLVLDDARDPGGSFLLADPSDVYVARDLTEVPTTLERAREAQKQGKIVGGFMAYEAGAAFEPRLQSKLPICTEEPLVWFGSFNKIRRIDLGSFAQKDCQKTQVNLDLAWSREEYQRATEDVLAYIADGDIYQANLTFCANITADCGPLIQYLRLRDRQRAGWGGLAFTGEQWLLSLSPEQFFVLKDGFLESQPMKGTARRGSTKRCDEMQIQKLRNCTKERAENLMIVDLIRNDLSKISQPGTVRVPDLFLVETYPTVHQMTSRVTARLAVGRDAFDVIKAAFPCGSVTGAPKIRAMEILATTEAEPRGSYTGSLGVFLPDGSAAFNVLIRTLCHFPGESHYRVHVGSGITVGSTPEAEWDECSAKLDFITLQ